MAVLTGRVFLPNSPNPVVRRPGLFDAATGPLDLPINAREGGLQYQTAVCELPACYEVLCQDNGGRGTKSFLTGPSTITGDPFIVYSEITCSPVGMTDEQLQKYLYDRLTAGEQSTVENVFSRQSCGQAPGLSNNAAVVTVTAAAVDPVKSLSLLEAALAASYGMSGIIHVPMALAAYYTDLFLVEKEGNLWYTRGGNKVVFGNYAGRTPVDAAPAANETWVYATGQVAIWRDSETFATNRAMTLNRTTNKVTAVMERTYVVDFDCLVLAAQTKITGVVA